MLVSLPDFSFQVIKHLFLLLSWSGFRNSDFLSVFYPSRFKGIENGAFQRFWSLLTPIMNQGIRLYFGLILQLVIMPRQSEWQIIFFLAFHVHWAIKKTSIILEAIEKCIFQLLQGNKIFLKYISYLSALIVTTPASFYMSYGNYRLIKIEISPTRGFGAY